MNFKFLALSFSLLFFSGARAASRNFCDDLIDANNSSAEDIANCQKQFGVSAFYSEQQENQKTQSQSSALVAADTDKKIKNLETQEFSAQDLSKAGFGQPFFARTDDYRTGPEVNDELTSRDDLCVYLGYEKATASILSKQINQPDANGKGLIYKIPRMDKIARKLGITTVPKPAIYKQDNPKVGVRKYISITCIRRKDKALDPSSDAIKSVIFKKEEIENAINQAPTDNTSQIDNTKREAKKVSTPHGYKIPDWMKDDSKSGSQK